MITFRSVLTGMVLLALSAVSLAAAWQVISGGLETSSLGAPDEIFAWLADHDVRPLPRGVQMKLVHRLEGQMRAGADPYAQLVGLRPAQRGRLQQNVQALTTVWLQEKVAGYFARDEDDRGEYIDRELAAILQWPAIVRQTSEESGAAAVTDRSGLVNQLIELAPLVEHAIQQSDVEERRRIQEFVVAVQNRAAAQRILGGGRRRPPQ
jgi:hypothetical protein